MNVKDTFRKIIIAIIEWEAILVLKKYKPRIIAVTGSVGKTSSKDAIYAVMSTAFFVRKSEKSFNSDIGVPLAILGCSNAWNNPFLWVKNIIEGLLLIALKNHYPKWLVLEVGADRPGDIKNICRWLKPDITVITTIPDVPVHVEFFSSPEKVVEEKECLVRALKPEGTLVLNHDDLKVRGFAQKYSHPTLTFGFEDGARFQASREVFDIGKRQTSFRVDSNGSSVPVVITGALGRQHIYPVLAAFAVGASQGLDMASMAGAFEHYESPPGRMKILDGVRKSIIIDDSYNSSPAALAEALSVLKGITPSGTGRKYAVLGDMMELGTYSIEEHRKAGALVATGADRLVTVGIRALDAHKEALRTGMDKRYVFHFEDSLKAADKVRDMLDKGDVMLVKGSQSMRMERIVKAAITDKRDAEKLLVRQDKEWLRR